MSARRRAALALALLGCGQDGSPPSQQVLVAGNDPCAAQGATTGAPRAVPDLGTLTDSITLAPATGGDTVQRVSVTVDVVHTYPRDLDITLVSPSGTEVLLVSHLGRGSGFVETVFRDDAPTAIQDGTESFTGSYRPAQPLAALIGERASGTWSLRVADTALGDTGTLEAWSVRVETCTAPPCAGAPLTVPMPDPMYADGLTQYGEVTGRGGATVEDAQVMITAIHPFDAQLDIYLAAPSGKRIELSTGNGGSGNDYWFTLFDDDATRSITQGAAPFTGSYRPEEPLAHLRGEPVEGTWSLIVHDTVADEYVGRVAIAQVDLQLCELPCPAGTVPVYAAAPMAAGLFEDMPVIAQVPDPGTARAAIEVPAGPSARVARVAARATVVHPDPSQLTVTLRAPSGAQATLASHAGAPIFRRMFADVALQGELAFGVWELDVTDDVSGGGAGQLVDAEVFLCLQ